MRFFAWLGRMFHDPRQCGAARSPNWPAIRKGHLQRQPECQVCGCTSGVEVHHILPFHVFPELELDGHNLITLCKRNGCHFAFGHLFDWTRSNPTIRQDAAAWRSKRERRDA